VAKAWQVWARAKKWAQVLGGCERPQRVTIEFETGDPLECGGLAGGVARSRALSLNVLAIRESVCGW
jgi:hypothetical protein